MASVVKNTFRKIIHIDMDAFFASVEQLDFPEYRGKPLVVGGNSQRGVIAAASYEARKYGIHSAMPSKIAVRKCPHLIFAGHRFDRYKELSNKVFEILHDFTDCVEAVSIDEAYLDVTENKINMPSATIIAKKIKKRIHSETGLTASAGVSFNKFLAKIASDYQKPDGLFVILPEDAEFFVDELPIEKFHGVGKVTAQKMHAVRIFTGKDLKSWKKSDLIRLFGKHGSYFFMIARAKDNRKVNPVRIRKSISTERTFKQDISDPEQLSAELENVIEELFSRISKKKILGKTLTLKVKFHDFDQITRSRTVEDFFSERLDIKKVAKELMDEANIHKSVRLLGLGVSNFKKSEDLSDDIIQLKLDF